MATTNNKSKNTNDNTSQGPQIGSMYIVDGAIYKCSGGLIISKIVSDKAKVYMQKNAMITTDDKKFSNSFGNCTLQPTTPSGPPPCSGYTSLEWQQDATIDTKNNNLPTENSKLQCKAGGGIVSCLNPGQIQSIGKLDFESVKYENSLFPYSPMTIEFDRSKCLFRPFGVSMTKAFRFPPEKKEKEEFKMREVQIRKTEQLQFCAYEDKNGKIEIKDKPINWAVCQIEEVKPEQTDKNKAIKYRLKKVTMYRNVLGIFDYKFDDAGKYIVEGMGNKETLDNYLKMEEDVSRYNLKKEKKQLTEEEKEATNYNWENIKKTDKNCTMRFEVLPNNSITGLWSGKRKIDETKPIYVKQKEEKVITAKLTFPFDSKYDEMECFVTNSLGQKLFESEYKLSENNQQITLTPVNADVVYNIQFRLYSKDNASKSGEKPISEKNIIVHSYNDAVLHVYAPTLDTTSLENSVAINSENLILSRPGETLAFYVTADQSINNDHVILSVKKIEDPISQYITEKDTIKGGRLYLFRKEGFYIVEADLKNTVYSNGGVKVDDKDGKIAKGDCTEREITHTIEIAENIVTKISVKSTCGEWYAGVVYPIALNFKYGKSTRLNEEKAVQMQLAEPSGIVAENLFNDNRKRRFLADSPGEYTIKGVLNGVECLSDVIKVVEPTFIKWEFCDSKKNKITRTARGLKFGINGNVPAWSLIDGENETQKRLIHVVLSVSVRGDNNSVSLEPIIADLDKRGCFNVENIDVKEVIEKAKKQNLFEESNRIDEDLIIKFLVFQAKNDSGKDQNLSTSIKDLSGDWIKGLQSINTSLTVTRKFFIDGYFTEGEGRKLVNVLRYGDEVNVHLHILNAPDILLKNMELHVYEDKPENDEVVFKKEKNIELDSDGCVDIQIPTNDQGIKESDHGESLLPRLFYFKVVCPDKEDLKEFVSLNQCIVNDNFFRLFVYPISPGELHAYNVRALLNGDKPVDDFEEKKKEALDYYYQLKLLPKGKEEKDFIDTYNKLGPVVVGKDFDSPDFCRGNKCMTMANYRSMKNASQLVKEINIRLAGFGGDAGCPLPSDSFSYRTERAIRQFQRDVMGIQPTGRICGSLLKAIDEFCENKDYDINFGQLKCKCGKLEKTAEAVTAKTAMLLQF
ncbi:MAG TPA: PAAR-like protein, partial [Paludibacteraceae bacterium]|nr:PAAR-like protein [Paludibacteraceae bacterium]HQF49981.1 PAAR-like protein [Paludibacteraceae bacterium]HQJ89223.1 PAAR-like protein [Paludibacteraceae bacterium]